MTNAIYLCGGINGLSDHDALWWRATASGRLHAAGFDVLDPMRRDWRGRELGNERAIIEGDLKDIDDSGLVLAFCLRPSWGTAMEIRYAWDKRIPVYAVVSFAQPVSPWIRYHCGMLFNDVTEAVEQIILHGIPKHHKSEHMSVNPLQQCSAKR